MIKAYKLGNRLNLQKFELSDDHAHLPADDNDPEVQLQMFDPSPAPAIMAKFDFFYQPYNPKI